MKIFGIVCLIVLALVGLKACGIINFAVNDAIKLGKKELSPTAIQRKYEWFKDASARLDSLSQQIVVSKQAIEQVKADYGNDSSKWPRDVRQDISQLRAEMIGVISVYNRLQGEYNAQSSKWNWEHFKGMSPLKQNYVTMSE